MYAVFRQHFMEEQMVKPYSVDLRSRVLAYIEETADKTKASQLFKVGIATIYRWIARKKQSGTVEPSPSKVYKKKIDDQKLIAYMEQNPDHFLSEIATHFNATLQAIFYALQRLKITRKKRLRFTRKETKKSEQSLYKK
jgi:transposase